MQRAEHVLSPHRLPSSKPHHSLLHQNPLRREEILQPSRSQQPVNLDPIEHNRGREGDDQGPLHVPVCQRHGGFEQGSYIHGEAERRSGPHSQERVLGAHTVPGNREGEWNTGSVHNPAQPEAVDSASV